MHVRSVCVGVGLVSQGYSMKIMQSVQRGPNCKEHHLPTTPRQPASAHRLLRMFLCAPVSWDPCARGHATSLDHDAMPCETTPRMAT